MKNEIKIVQCTPIELEHLISNGIKKELIALKAKFETPKEEKLLTRKEVCEKLTINLSTLWKWTKKGKLHSHNIGNRVYYKLSEIENSLIKSL